LALIILIVTKHGWRQRRKWWTMGLGLSAIYLLYCLFNKTMINSEVKSIMKKQNIQYERYFTTPTTLQNWLWYVVAGNDSGYYVGYRSVFDSKKQIDFEYFPRSESLLDSVEDSEGLQKLKRFSQELLYSGEME
jgi:inner membrane protein